MAIHTEYSLRHKVEFRPDEFAELDRLDAVRPYQLRLPGVPEVRHADAEQLLSDNYVRICQHMTASAWAAIATIKRSM